MNQSLVKTKTRSHVNTNRLIIKFASMRIGQSIQRYRQHKSASLRSVKMKLLVKFSFCPLVNEFTYKLAPKAKQFIIRTLFLQFGL